MRPLLQEGLRSEGWSCVIGERRSGLAKECQPGGGTDSASPGTPRWYGNDDHGESSVHRSGLPGFMWSGPHNYLWGDIRLGTLILSLLCPGSQAGKETRSFRSMRKTVCAHACLLSFPALLDHRGFQTLCRLHTWVPPLLAKKFDREDVQGPLPAPGVTSRVSLQGWKEVSCP